MLHFHSFSQIWDEFVPSSQISTRVRPRNSHTETGELGPETVDDVRRLYSGFTVREQEALRLLRKGGVPESSPLDASAAAAASSVNPQELKKELAEIKESLAATENMLALFVTRHSSVSPEDARVILEVRQLMQHVKLLVNM